MNNTSNQLVLQDLSVLEEQIQFHEKRALSLSSLKKEEWRSKIHQDTAEKLKSMRSRHIELFEANKALNDEVEYLKLTANVPQSQNSSKAQKSIQQLHLNLDDIKDLPPELIKELNIDTEGTEFTIISIIDESCGISTLDKILIGLYKKTGQINKRTQLNNKILRMIQRGDIFSVSGKKGVYTTINPNTDNEQSEWLISEGTIS